jgi:nucleotide-binding universal stress UspA family protein
MMPASDELDSVESELLRHADVALDDAVRTVDQPGCTVERLTLRGRPASAIVEEARAWKADLVVLGNRGHGPIASMVLGSVSAEVVDHAPCPVFVVRDEEIASIVFAEDGSPGAARAARVIRTWPFLHGLPVDVVSVAETAVPWNAGMATGLYDEVMVSYAHDVEAARESTRALAHRCSNAREGDPAREIVEFARARPGSLVVVGTRGHGGLARLVLGSVARNVLLHAPGSVLVVRETVGTTEIEATSEPEHVASGRA